MPLLLLSTHSLVLMVRHVAVVGLCVGVTQNSTGYPDSSFDFKPPFVFAA